MEPLTKVNNRIGTGNKFVSIDHNFIKLNWSMLIIALASILVFQHATYLFFHPSRFSTWTWDSCVSTAIIAKSS